jgi:hypothetical protein
MHDFMSMHQSQSVRLHGVGKNRVFILLCRKHTWGMGTKWEIDRYGQWVEVGKDVVVVDLSFRPIFCSFLGFFLESRPGDLYILTYFEHLFAFSFDVECELSVDKLKIFYLGTRKGRIRSLR